MSVFGNPLPPTPSKADHVYEQVCAAIFAGRLLPGDRVNVDEITRSLGVSKIPVREALQRLETRGLIVQTPHAGARVAPVSRREWEGLFLIRIELEGLAARLAAPRVTAADLAELRAIHRQAAAEHAAGVLDEMSVLNRRFHQVITRIAGFDALSELVEQVLLTVARYRAAMERDPNVWHASLTEHAALIDALATRDPAVAERAAVAHVQQQLESTVTRRFGVNVTPAAAPVGAGVR